jgi:4-amino-4-deoxy-L-arabinose transferase-like glycosyltransferase
VSNPPTSADRAHWVGLIGPGLAAAAGAAQFALLLYIFFSRLTYPGDLEWMEGGMLGHALRIAQGLTLYGEPSAEFISYLYTPLYPAVLAALGKLFGLGYGLARTVSVISFLGATFILCLAVYRQSGKRLQGVLWAIAAAGIIASSFPHTGGWHDLARNDSLYLLLICGGLYLLIYHHQRYPGLVASGILMGLAFLTKQTASLFIIAAGTTLLITRWRRLFLYVPLVGIIAGGTTLVMAWLTDGWSWRYTFEMHQGHDFYWDRIWPVSEKWLFEHSPVVISLFGLWLLIATALWIRARIRKTESGHRGGRENIFWAAIALVGIAISAVGYATQWAEMNAFTPGLIFPGVFACVAAADLVRRVYHRRWTSALLSIALGGAIAAQLLLQLYSPKPHLPEPRDWKSVPRLVSIIQQIEGPVLIPYHPFYNHLAGKKTHYHQMGINDVTRAGYPFPKDLRERIEKGYYAAIITDRPPERYYSAFFKTYKFSRYLSKASPRVVSGYRVRPRYVMVPKTKDPALPKGRRIFDFEDETYKGWEKRGAAFGRRPAGGSANNQKLNGPYAGKCLVSSATRGDRQTGSLLSPELILDHPRIAYRIGGGSNRSQTYMRLMVDGKEVHRDAGKNSHIMKRKEVNLGKFMGKKIRVELVDRATGSWGHILFDDFQFLPAK